MAGGNHQKQPRKSWLTQQRERFGDNWVDKVDLIVIHNNLLRILTDISKGYFDCTEGGGDMRDFCHTRIYSSLYEYSYKKYVVLGDILNALTIMHEYGMGSQNTPNIINEVMNLRRSYEAVVTTLQNYRINYDSTAFMKMVQVLKDFKNYIDLNNALI